jgi:hypothetical protein
MEGFNNAEGSKHTDAEVLRKFLGEDDGSEFVMLNQVQLHGGNVAHPVSGKKMPASKFLGKL